ncbi:hypothetical protein [Rhizobium grahamii]|uniref:Uncharacterized protein n=1 Tax=Rhizobium grahamii TaxID=1120045 RepID=A0A370KIT6_9HYPH|nr:hypothetical protein [Rhizobium grahamii]RDJ05682.1 hypothetical protein B5K06_24860 [Rhizobium grahamii]
MTSIQTAPDFMSDLVRAINQIHLLTLEERREMVAGGTASIHDLRATLDQHGADTPMASRTLREVERLIAEMGDTPNELVAAAFVVLCDQINKC